jgi:hypothetical protein
MPAVIQGTFNNRSSGAVLSLALSVTVGAGTNLGLVVHVATIWNVTVDLVTYGGVPLTSIGQAQTGSYRNAVFALPSPPVGTADVVVHLSGSQRVAVAAHVLTAYGDARNFTNTSGNSTTPSVTVASAAGELVLDLVGSETSGQTFTVGAGQTSLHENDGVAGTDVRTASSSEPGAASVTMSWTIGTSAAWWIGAVSVLDDTNIGTLRLSAQMAEAWDPLGDDVDLHISAQTAEAWDPPDPTDPDATLQIAAQIIEIWDAPEPDPPEPGGEVPTATNPPTAPIPVGVLRHWFELTLDGVVLARAEATLRDPAGYHGGLKPGTLRHVGDIDRELLPRGEIRPVEIDVTVIDVDRLFRTAAESSTISRCYGRIAIISDDDRYAQLEPYYMFRGRIADHGTVQEDGPLYGFTLRDALSEATGDLDQSARIPANPMSKAVFPWLADEMDGKVAPALLGKLSDEDAAVPQGLVSPIVLGYLNFQDWWSGDDVDVIAGIISQGTLATNEGVGTKAFYNPPDTPDTRVEIPLSEFGVNVWMPGMPGWSATGLTTDYVDFPLPLDATTRRYTPFFVRRSHPLADAFIKRQVLVGINAHGLAEDAEGSNIYISDPPRIWQWVVVNQIFVPYTTGPYAGIPTFDGTVSVINTDLVERTRARQHARLTGGYPIAVVVGRDGNQQTAAHILTEILEGSDMEQGTDRHGRAFVDTEDPDAEPVAHLSDLHDIESGTFRTWCARDQFYDRLLHSFGYRHTPPSAPTATAAEGEPQARQIVPYSPWRSGLREIRHEAAITANQGFVRTRTVENFVVQDADVAADLEARWSARHAGLSLDGPWYFEQTGPLGRLLGLELGDNILITHCDGLGPNGFEGRKARVMRIRHSLQTRRTTIGGYIHLEAAS